MIIRLRRNDNLLRRMIIFATRKMKVNFLALLGNFRFLKITAAESFALYDESF